MTNYERLKEDVNTLSPEEFAEKYKRQISCRGCWYYYQRIDCSKIIETCRAGKVKFLEEEEKKDD